MGTGAGLDADSRTTRTLRLLAQFRVALAHEVAVRVGMRRLVSVVALVFVLCLANCSAPGSARAANSFLVYAGYVLVSIFGTQYWTLLVAYALQLVSVLCYGRLRRATSRRGTVARTALGFLVHQGSLLESSAPWMALILTSNGFMPARVGAALAVWGFYPMALLGPTLWTRRFVDSGVDRLLGDPSIQWRGWTVGLAGYGLLLIINPAQVERLLPSTMIVVGFGLLRTLALTLRSRAEDAPPQRLAISEETQLALGLSLLALFIGGLVVSTNFRGASFHATDRDESFLLTARELPRGPAPDRQPDASIFLVADSQFHEMAGALSSGHLQLIDYFVPVAIRPVELDLLSGVSLSHFAGVYRDLPKSQSGSPIPWAHLGDMGDLGCLSELRRFDPFVDLFGHSTLAALTPGNHDSTFMGNFPWHPDWERACGPQHAAGKKQSDEALLAILHKGTLPNAAQIQLTHILGTSALVQSAPLGALGGKALEGLFLDTSDFTSAQLGSAGAQGCISLRQLELAEERVHAKDPQADSRVILFMHHPYAELSAWGAHQINQLAADLGSRLIAIVSAHTHRVGCRNLEFKRAHKPNLRVPELVVGSTIDPPQQATLLNLFAERSTAPLVPDGNAVSRIVIQLRSIQAIERGDHAVGAGVGDCRERLRRIVATPACVGLRDDKSPLGPECDDSQDPRSEQHRTRQAEQARAEKLLTCLGITNPHCPLGPDSHALEELDRETFKRYVAHDDSFNDWVCLSWAASLMQNHKRQRWAFRDAIDYAVDGASAPPNKEIVVTVGEEGGCQEP